MHLVFIVGSHSLQDKYKLLNASIFIKNTNDVLKQITFRCAMKHKIVVVKKYEQLMKSSDPLYVIDIALYYFVNSNCIH